MGAGGEGLRRDAQLMAARIAVALFGPPGQGSFNEVGARAFEALRERGIACDLHWIAPPDATGRAAALETLCGAGLDLLVAHGGQGDAPVERIAARHPAVTFAITQGSFLAANVACYEVMQEESAFLGGVLAASITRSKVVAHLSGERVRPGLKGRAAFAHGVRAADPSIRLLTTFCGNQHDPPLAARTVERQADAGADVLFAMIDGGRSGAIEACRRRGVAQIGNVLDWTAREPDVFIASAIADSGWGVRAAVRDFLAGRIAPGTRQTMGLADPQVVRLALAERVDSAARAAVDRFAAELRAGSLRIDADYGGSEF